MRTEARGQTLVLFALTMLAMVVMVCITLAIGMKAREKMELQTMADAAAYSNAIETARTYNAVSILTRAQISQMVALAGAQSHISYAGWYLGALRRFQTNLAAAIAQNCPGGGCLVSSCAQAEQVMSWLNTEIPEVTQQLEALDPGAAQEALQYQGLAGNHRDAQRALYDGHLIPFISDPQRAGFTRQIIDLAVPDTSRRAEYVISAGGVGVSTREIRNAYKDSDPDLALQATHGSRRSNFTRNRGLSAQRLMAVAGAGINGATTGSGYFGEGIRDVSAVDGQEAWAHDDGAIGGSIGCLAVPGASITASVRSTHIGDSNDSHDLGDGPHAHSSPMHTMGPCTECPSVWVTRVDYNLGGEADQWGQPKQYVVLDRDYTRRNGPQDPWNLFFNFRFSNAGNGQTIDIGKQQGDAAFRHQVAAATAITYYHRHGFWAEPPNFFNPFWRATLVPADIDAQGASDVNVAAAALGPEGAAAMDALRNAGFRGWQ